MKPTRKFPGAIAALAFAASAVLAACATTPPTNAALDGARAAYTQANADPVVARSAPAELQRAEQALQRAETALQSGAPTSDVDHYAYLARQRTAVAIEAGKVARADQQIADSQAERDRIVLASRTRDAEAERAAAQRAQASAQSARAEADQARDAAMQQQANANDARNQALASQAYATELQSQLADLKAKQTNRGMVLTLGDVLFDTDRATLKPGADRTLGQVSAFLAHDPSRKLRIEGYTDSTGSEAHNEELSQERADAVRAALVDRGVNASRIEVHGMSERYAVASNGTAAGRQLNRRVELVFSRENGDFQTTRQ